jgi:hypothetical protein
MKRLAITLTLAAFAALTGCQNADPSARSNRAAYRDIGRVEIRGSSNTVSITVGDGIYASADGGGDAMEASPTQTTETKPEIAAAWGGASAGTGGATPSGGLDAETLKKFTGLASGAGGAKLTAEEAAALKDCIDGNCTIQ